MGGKEETTDEAWCFEVDCREQAADSPKYFVLQAHEYKITFFYGP